MRTELFELVRIYIVSVFRQGVREIVEPTTTLNNFNTRNFHFGHACQFYTDLQKGVLGMIIAAEFIVCNAGNGREYKIQRLKTLR